MLWQRVTRRQKLQVDFHSETTGLAILDAIYIIACIGLFILFSYFLTSTSYSPLEPEKKAFPRAKRKRGGEIKKKNSDLLRR